MFKYGPRELAELLAKLFNQAFENGEDIGSYLGQGVLCPLQKPGKEAGPCKNLRPVMLLLVLRKAFSLIVLKRVSKKFNDCVSSSQSGFREGRSTSDLTWAHRFLVARAGLFKKSMCWE